MSRKFRAHETFFIRKGWISKGMKHVHKKSNVFTDKKEKPMDVLGIGTSMVKSLRYWLQATDLTKESKTGKRDQSLTEFGNIVFNNDRYVEEMGTLQLLQYKLVSNIEMAPSWNFFFNKFSMNEFNKEDFIFHIQNELKMTDESVAVRSLTDDFFCIINTYVQKYKLDSKKVSPENNISCPLSELGLIDILSKEQGKVIYKKMIPTAETFNPWVVLAIICEQSNGKKEISLNELLASSCNIGKIFNLDSITMLDILHNVEKTGEIRIIRTAGLDIIRIKNNRTFMECVEKYYSGIEGK